MASRLGLDQSVMGNLASSNLVSASFFLPHHLLEYGPPLYILSLSPVVVVHNTADQTTSFQPQF
jgi:hypothetical protein